jgi:hypothetical protein
LSSQCAGDFFRTLMDLLLLSNICQGLPHYKFRGR